MTYEIDQSGKIEQTELDTIIAITNGKNCAVMLRKRTKRTLQLIFRNLNKPEMYIYHTFAALIAFLLFEIQPRHHKIMIDTEYQGKEDLIRVLVFNIFDRLGWRRIEFEFGYVGKSSRSHLLASLVAQKKIKPDKILTLEDVTYLVMNKNKD